MEEISLNIRGQLFKIKKETLAEHSDYFRAMFNGNYVENNQQQITIDMLDPNTMGIIIKYMQIGLIDLLEYSLSTIGDIAVTANFLQITELIKQIEYSLDLQVSECNWMETLAIAENSSYSKLEYFTTAFGLFSFKSMKPEHVPSLHKLAWYLSHPYLDAKSELDVFNFGLKWIFQNETGADALLVILGCLDIRRLERDDVKEMKNLMLNFENSLAAKVIDCILELINNNIGITTDMLINKKAFIVQQFTERVWSEACSIVRESKSRMLEYTPVIPMWLLKDSKPELLPHFLYTYKEKEGFEQWLEVAEKNLWGWNIISWGLTKLVVVCGEHGRGTGIFMRDVKVYDTLRKEWTRHGVELPQRRHAGIAVVGDSLYLVGGVGGFRVVLETAGIYDLKQRTYRKIAKFPDAIQYPAVCSHKNMVYAAGHRNIYRYEVSGNTDNWSIVIGTEIRMSCLRSYNNYIYCTQTFFSHLYRFRPDVDKKLELIRQFSHLPATICNLGNRIVVFTRTVCGHSGILSVEEYKEESLEEKPKVLFTKSNSSMRVNDVAGSCVLVIGAPHLRSDISQYQKRYLTLCNYPIKQ